MIVTCIEEERKGEKRGEERRGETSRKKKRGYAISGYCSAQCSPGDRFDVNMKGYSITFY